MLQESKTCQNCKKPFAIEPDDFAFYEKIKVPSPTWCSKCRFQRRLTVFNLMNLFRRPCDLCKKDVISMYRPDAPYKVYCPHCFWSDDWDPFEYGRDYDFSRPFFEQFNELCREVPLIGLSIDAEAQAYSPHTNHAGHIKNCYLIFFADYNEDCSYGTVLVNNKNVLDSSLIGSSELCYDSLHSFKNNRGIGLNHVAESIDCAFLKDCSNCQNCFASANLRNQKYYIFNKPYTKEEYLSEIKKWDLGSWKTYQEIKRKAEEHWRNFPPKPRWDEFSVNVTGNYVFGSKNCQECFEVTDAQDSKFLFLLQHPSIRDCYDCSSWGNVMSLCYECCIVGEGAANVRFSQESGGGATNIEYSKLSLLGGASNHFGCVSVKKGNYCIMNKRYSEEDYKNLRTKIIEQMESMPYKDKKGRVYKYGEFFPPEISPLPYNDTLANIFFPLSEAEAGDSGYKWAGTEKREYAVTKQSADLPDHIKNAPDEILKEVVGCASCGRGFKIIPSELAFLRRMNVPLPRECPFCRIGGKFKKWTKNLRIFQRTCDKCGAEFETSYPKEEVEKILCKKCYLAEVV